MSVSFPASHLSAHDVGKRIKAVTLTGATIIDTLVGITATYNCDTMTTSLFLRFEGVLSEREHIYLDDRGFQIDPEQYVKRIEK